jgi:tight adherence protein C
MMRFEQIAILVVLFVIVFAAALTAMNLLRPNVLKRRIDQVGAASGSSADALEPADDGKWIEKLAKVSSRVAKFSQPTEDWNRSLLRVRFSNAGLRSESAPAIYFAAKTLLALLFPGIVLIALAGKFNEMPHIYLLFALLLASAVGFYLPNMVLSRLVESRKLALFEDLPDAVDLMTVCVEAGLGFDAALARVAEEIGIKSAALHDELELVLLELRAGSGRDKALRNLALRTAVEDIDTLATMLIQADRFGTSIGESLRVYTDNLRLKRRQRAEEKAAKISLKLLFPLVFFIFPSLFVVLIAPVALQVMRTLGPSFKSFVN